MSALPYLGQNRRCDPVGLRFEILDIAAFDQEADQRFGAGVAEQHATVVAEFFLGLVYQRKSKAATCRWPR